MDPTTHLAIMLTTYAIPIMFVYYKYRAADDATRSISSIITSKEPFLTFSENIPTPLIWIAPPCIPNKTLYRVVYADHGGVHRAL